MNFSEKALEFVQPDSKVLDLGAGNGWFSKECLQRGAIVTAVDQKRLVENLPEIDWQTVSIQDFIDQLPTSNTYNLIYSRNLIQFLDADWVETTLWPILLERLESGGIIAVQTFYQDPEPPFETRLSSVYTTNDLKKILPGLEVILEEQFSKQSPDMMGIPRMFFITNLIVKKA